MRAGGQERTVQYAEDLTSLQYGCPPGSVRAAFHDLKPPRGDHEQAVLYVPFSYRRFSPGIAPRLGVAQYNSDFVVAQITQEPAIALGITRLLEKG